MPKLRARYLTKRLGKQPVTFTKAWMDEDTKSLQMKQVTEDRECFMVMFPQGHSIRVTSREQLAELGFDKKPRTVDMETGDVVDIGGDIYDFDNMPNENDIVLAEEDLKSTKSTSKQHANA
jgi:hypothetical protein